MPNHAPGKCVSYALAHIYHAYKYEFEFEWNLKQLQATLREALINLDNIIFKKLPSLFSSATHTLIYHANTHTHS